MYRVHLNGAWSSLVVTSGVEAVMAESQHVQSGMETTARARHMSSVDSSQFICRPSCSSVYSPTHPLFFLAGMFIRGNVSGSRSFAMWWLLLSALVSLNLVWSATVGGATLQPSSWKYCRTLRALAPSS